MTAKVGQLTLPICSVLQRRYAALLWQVASPSRGTRIRRRVEGGSDLSKILLVQSHRVTVFDVLSTVTHTVQSLWTGTETDDKLPRITSTV